MNVAYYFHSKINLVFQNQEKIDFQMFVIHLNGQNLKTLLLPILGIKMIFCKEMGGLKKILLYMWAKYEPIWSDFTAKTVTLGANLHVQAQTIPQNAKCACFFKTKSCVD